MQSLLELKHVEIGKIEIKNDLDKATQNDVKVLLDYISSLEALIEDNDQDDVFGTEGWEHAIEGYLE